MTSAGVQPEAIVVVGGTDLFEVSNGTCRTPGKPFVDVDADAEAMSGIGRHPCQLPPTEYPESRKSSVVVLHDPPKSECVSGLAEFRRAGGDGGLRIVASWRRNVARGSHLYRL